MVPCNSPGVNKHVNRSVHARSCLTSLYHTYTYIYMSEFNKYHLSTFNRYYVYDPHRLLIY